MLFAALPGDDKPDDDLWRASSVARDDWEALWAYCVEGGPENATNLLRYCSALPARRRETGACASVPESRSVLAGARRLRSGNNQAALDRRSPRRACPCFTALWRSAAGCSRSTKWRWRSPAMASIHFLSLLRPEGSGIGRHPRAALRSVATRRHLKRDELRRLEPPGIGPRWREAGDAARCSRRSRSAGGVGRWHARRLGDGLRGLSARDIAMNVALPELDGRVLTRSISFKGEAYYDEATQCPVAAYRANPDRIEFTAELAANWATLARTPAPGRRVCDSPRELPQQGRQAGQRRRS